MQGMLPDQIYKIDSELKVVIKVKDYGVPLHPQTIKRLVATVKAQKKAVAFSPKLPIISDLGLPSYPTIAHAYPQILNNDLSTNFTICDSSIKSSEIGFDEQLHYFADYYGKVIRPSYIRVIIGNTCNLKCVMCPYHSSSLKMTHTTDFFQGKKEMSWEMMKRLAQESGQAELPILIGSVEEPLLHPKLVDFIELCRQQGVPRVHLTTNGQLLDEKCSRALLKAGLTSIDISIDAATPETYKKIRGADLNRLECNIIDFVKIRDELEIACEVRTSFVRNKNVTQEEEEAFKNRWLSRINGIFILNMAEYEEQNMRLKHNNQAVHKSIQYYQKQSQGRWTCLFPFIEMAVLPDGRIYYCIESLFRLGFDNNLESLGDYHQQTLQEIWTGDLFQKLRGDLISNQLEKREACKNCDMWKSQVVNQNIRDEYQVLTTTVAEIYQNISKLNYKDEYIQRQ
ncbi:MAG: radical SAM protein [Microcystis aeruginosa LG13-03]|nr:radical SAM protein [Microcystis aeruginosa LG13-13]NCR03618.1 radical SAM protein [Microcystis aeruginosa LG13-03]NCR61705.1 radical SAM protein [Microcystis aeruginosa LG11-05]